MTRLLPRDWRPVLPERRRGHTALSRREHVQSVGREEVIRKYGSTSISSRIFRAVPSNARLPVPQQSRPRPLEGQGPRCSFVTGGRSHLRSSRAATEWKFEF